MIRYHKSKLLLCECCSYNIIHYSYTTENKVINLRCILIFVYFPDKSEFSAFLVAHDGGTNYQIIHKYQAEKILFLHPHNFHALKYPPYHIYHISHTLFIFIIFFILPALKVNSECDKKVNKYEIKYIHS